jgi:AcrR family transcriptional regulator
VTHPTASPSATGTRNKETTKLGLISAVGTLLAREGFNALGINAVAAEAGVNKVLIYRYFGGMDELLSAFGQSSGFWPSVAEVMGEDREALMKLSVAERWAMGLSRYAASLRSRPVTKEILAWELIEQNDLIQILRKAREEWFEELMTHFPDDADLTDAELIGTVLVVVGAIHYFIVLGRLQTDFSGIEIDADVGWEYLDLIISTMLERTLTAPN